MCLRSKCMENDEKTLILSTKNVSLTLFRPLGQTTYTWQLGSLVTYSQQICPSYAPNTSLHSKLKREAYLNYRIPKPTSFADFQPVQTYFHIFVMLLSLVNYGLTHVCNMHFSIFILTVKSRNRSSLHIHSLHPIRQSHSVQRVRGKFQEIHRIKINKKSCGENSLFSSVGS